MSKEIDLNDFAVQVAKEEHGARQVDVAQIKEILRITFTKLAGMKPQGLPMSRAAAREQTRTP